MVFNSMDPDLVDANVQFEMHRDCQPTVTTETSSKELPRGQKMTDRVISSIDAANGDEQVIDPQVFVVTKVGAVVMTLQARALSLRFMGWEC